MTTKGSVTQWLEAVELGDEIAAQRLWERYYSTLLSLARARISRRSGRAFDEQDVVLNVFEACYRGLQSGRFPYVNDRHDLWRLLITLTARKAIDATRREQRQKRGGGLVFSEADRYEPGEGSGDGLLAGVVGREPTPEFTARVTEDLQQRLELLPNPRLREICLWKMEGYTNEEVAARLDCTIRTVERKLELIRKHWLISSADDGRDGALAIP
jgi:RNA polymerase sigma factor (sigma-70 family)